MSKTRVKDRDDLRFTQQDIKYLASKSYFTPFGDRIYKTDEEYNADKKTLYDSIKRNAMSINRSYANITGHENFPEEYKDAPFFRIYSTPATQQIDDYLSKMGMGKTLKYSKDYLNKLSKKELIAYASKLEDMVHWETLYKSGSVSYAKRVQEATGLKIEKQTKEALSVYWRIYNFIMQSMGNSLVGQDSEKVQDAVAKYLKESINKIDFATVSPTEIYTKFLTFISKDSRFEQLRKNATFLPKEVLGTGKQYTSAYGNVKTEIPKDYIEDGDFSATVLEAGKTLEKVRKKQGWTKEAIETALSKKNFL